MKGVIALDSNNLRKGAFTLRTESQVFHGREVGKGWLQEHQAAGHLVSRAERGMLEPSSLSHSR